MIECVVIMINFKTQNITNVVYITLYIVNNYTNLIIGCYMSLSKLVRV